MGVIHAQNGPKFDIKSAELGWKCKEREVSGLLLYKLLKKSKFGQKKFAPTEHDFKTYWKRYFDSNRETVNWHSRILDVNDL